MDQSITAAGLVALGDFHVDLNRGELRTAAGSYVDLRPRSFAVLRLLANRLGQVVSKREILDAVWGDAAVTEDSLTQCVADIRRAIGDAERRVLRNVPRRGYLLVTPAGTKAQARPSTRPVPETRYARSGNVHIAYQVTGEGPVDIVFVQGYVTHLEIEWEDPRPAGFFEQLSSLGRLIRFDKRGTGLSDRVAGLPTLEQRMDDVRAVMDAVGSHRAVLLGCSEGGPMSMLFAATHPERVRSLILCGTMARIAWAPDHPWGRTAEQLAGNVRTIEEKWGSGHSVDLFAPSHAADPAYRAWRARLDRAAASPGAAISLARMNFAIDVRHVLPSIAVPTLVMHRAGDIAVSVEHSRHLSSLIPGARYLELPGRDHAMWASDSEILCEAFRVFIEEAAATADPDRVLLTMVVIRFGPDRSCEPALERLLAQHRGRRVTPPDGRGFVAAFDGPARAVRCAQALTAALLAEGIAAHAGVHTGECEIAGAALRGTAVLVAARIADAAAPGEVLVSSTVRDLVGGSGLVFSAGVERSFEGLSDIVFHRIAEEP
jgi:pimeloyl-ACP methyl ester carboxylesterase